MIIIANHKMNLTYDEIKSYIKRIKPLSSNGNFIVCPSNIYILEFIKEGFNVCTQNISRYVSGAHTGEVSASQISSMGVKYTLLGHAEKRSYCKETNDVINLKMKNALENNIKVVLCVGESEEDRKNNNILEVLNKQLKECLNDINDITNIMIAYEPLCSVDTGYTLSNEEIQLSINYIRNFIYDKYNKNIEVLYGGSVNEENITTLKEINHIGGFLVGSSSLDSDKILKIMELVK